MKSDLSTTFSVPFHRLFTTFPVTETGVKRLKQKDLRRNRSETGGAERYGKKSVRVYAVSRRRVVEV